MKKLNSYFALLVITIVGSLFSLKIISSVNTLDLSNKETLSQLNISI